MKRIIIATVIAGAAIGATATAASANNGKPAGQGANACHQIYSSTRAEGEQVQEAIKINVGNPDEVLLAGDCEGGPIMPFVDDGLSLSLSNPAGKDGGNVSQKFYNFCGGSNNGGPALDVTEVFAPGTNSVELTITNDCGGLTFAPDLYLVVSQHTD